MYFLAIVGLLSTVVAAFYYLRIVKVMYFDLEKEKYDTDYTRIKIYFNSFNTINYVLFYLPK